MSKLAASFGWSLVVTAPLYALMAVLKERVLPLRQWLDDVTGSDWVTHGLLAAFVFVLLGFMLALENNDEFDEEAPRKVAAAQVIAIVASVVIIAVSYRFAG